MSFVRSPRTRFMGLALLAAAALAAIAVALLSTSPATRADVNLNNLDCHGHLEKGSPATDEVGDTNVGYTLACNGPITGYSLFSVKPIQGYETEVFGLDARSGAVFPNDSFSCTGDVPSYGINCNGFAGFLDNAKLSYDPSQKSYVQIKGNFSIDGSICDEPRADVVATVMTATKAANGNVVQSISGPFPVGRPTKTGCKYTKNAAKPIMPRDGADSSGDDSDVG